MKLLHSFYIGLAEAAEEAYGKMQNTQQQAFCSYISHEARKKAQHYEKQRERPPHQIL